MAINYATMTRVSTDSSGGRLNEGGSLDGSFSPDGNRVVFVGPGTSASPQLQIYVKNLLTGELKIVSTSASGAMGNGPSFAPMLSPDGKMVVFVSRATNLRGLSDTNSDDGIYLKNLETGLVTRFSDDFELGPGDDYLRRPVFSTDGGSVLFSSSSNLVLGANNGSNKVYVADVATGQVSIVSTNDDGFLANGTSFDAAFSRDGTQVAFVSNATNLVAGVTPQFTTQLYVKNLISGDIRCLSINADGDIANHDILTPTFSPDGSRVAFVSGASNLVANDTNQAVDIFVADLASGAIARVSTDSFGQESAFAGFASPTFSPDGNKIAFFYRADDLVDPAPPGVGTGQPNVFIKDLVTGLVTIVNLTAAGDRTSGQIYINQLAFSPDSKSIIFHGNGAFVANDTNGLSDVYVVRLTGGTSGNDVLAPTSAGEVIEGLGGSDRLMGSVLGDVLVGGSGADLVQGNSGDDTLRLGGGADLTAQSGATVRNADMVNHRGTTPDARSVQGASVTLDILDGGAGIDTVQGTAAAEVVALSAPGAAVFAGQSATARIVSVERFELGGGNDVLSLTTSAATKYTTAVTALGGGGDDTLWTGSGNDTLQGEAGNDYLVGGFGNDLLDGGAGNDLFGFSRNFGTDTVTGFTQGQDKLRIKGFGATRDSLAEIQPLIAMGDFDGDGTADDTRIALSTQGTMIILSGFTGTLTAGDFQFVA